MAESGDGANVASRMSEIKFLMIVDDVESLFPDGFSGNEAAMRLPAFAGEALEAVSTQRGHGLGLPAVEQVLADGQRLEVESESVRQHRNDGVQIEIAVFEHVGQNFHAIARRERAAEGAKDDGHSSVVQVAERRASESGQTLEALNAETAL